MSQSTTAITINELYSEYLDGLEGSNDKAVTLLRVISDNYFAKSPEALNKDANAKFTFGASYEEIQSLLAILFDYVWNVKEKIEAVMGADIIPNEAAMSPDAPEQIEG